MTKHREREADKVLLELLYEAVGNPPNGELVSEELLRERRKEASSEDHEDD